MQSPLRLSSRLGWRPRQRARRGLTLVDLSITILILGIAAAVTVPRFSRSLAAVRADAAARYIAADLNYARHRAQITSQNVVVNFSSATASYSMPTTPDLNRSGAPYSNQLANIGLPVTMTVNLQGTSNITYNSYGLPLAGTPLAAMTSGTITVTSGGVSKTVAINTQTGRASVQ